MSVINDPWPICGTPEQTAAAAACRGPNCSAPAAIPCLAPQSPPQCSRLWLPGRWTALLLSPLAAPALKGKRRVSSDQ